MLPDLEGMFIAGPLISRTRHLGRIGVNYRMTDKDWLDSEEVRVQTPQKAITVPDEKVKWR